jgi:hypothetical protein
MEIIDRMKGLPFPLERVEYLIRHFVRTPWLLIERTQRFVPVEGI